MTGNLSKKDAAFISDLYKQYHLPVMKIIRLNCFSNSTQDHEDILQEVFLMAVAKIDILKSHKKPSRWIYKTALHLTYNFNRLSMGQPEPSEENFLDLQAARSSSERFDEILLMDREKKITSDLFKLLSEDEKELYILRFNYRFSYKDIASVLHVSENNVGVRIYRLTRKIRKLTNDNEEN